MPCLGPFHFSHSVDYIYEFCPLPDPDVGPSIFVCDVEHTSFHFGLCSRKFILCLFGQCPGLCTICHSWQHTGVVHLSLQADGKVAFEDIPVFGVCRPACHDSSLYLFVMVLFLEAVVLSQVHIDIFYQHIVHVYRGVVYKYHLCLCDGHVKVALNQLYDDVVAAITMASQNSIHTPGVSRGNDFNRPGWKEFASDLYDIFRDAYFLWRDSGSPRQGMLFDMKNRTKARFKSAMRFIKNNEDTLKKDSLARKLLSKNDKEFWKEIRVMNSSNMPLPNVIDGVTGSGNIVDMWKSYYNDLFNCLRNNKDVKQLHTDVHYDANIEVTHSEIFSAINDLANNKSCGLDGVNAEHLKHCSDRIVPMCFTGLFIHGVLPPSIISVVLVPIVKNKRISICSKNNYRPIALASIMSKLLEKIIHERVSEALETCSNQFGFKAKHSRYVHSCLQGSHSKVP